jgi:hypothetical protein
MTGDRLPPRVRQLAGAALPAGLRPAVRRVAERRGWVSPPPSANDDPFEYPYWQILAHHGSTYPHYLWGTMCAAGLAAALELPRVTVIEFGVAGGNGLLELERVAAWVERRSGVGLDVVGFDSGTGLPQPEDYRDLPNLWSEGYFPMEPDRLRARLRRAKLVLGPVAETVPRFIESSPAPVGFISFDLDLYSSTMAAFEIFDADPALLLPRVTSYFDDIIGFSHGDFTGERLAISDFNQAHKTRKISKLYGLRWVLVQDKWWTDMMYMFHVFDHPSYNAPDKTNRRSELPLRNQ